MSSERLLYARLAQRIEYQIQSGTLQVGDKLPSVRSICREQGVSKSTALQAYYDLERKGFITARPRSGYYVSYSPSLLPAVPDTTNPIGKLEAETTEDLVAQVFSELGYERNVQLSLGVPAPELLPVAKLSKAVVQAMRTLPAGGTSYDRVHGSITLRRQIARSSLRWGQALHEDDIVTTDGCMHALSLCLIAVTKRGDTIAVESPVYFGILQLAQSLGLHVLELPTHAVSGVDIDALRNAIVRKRIKACVLVSNFSNPLGCSIPDDHKRAIAQLMEQHDVPLIEDDLYGDIYFGSHRPTTCKTYDESGIVLWCSSVSKTLAPGYRVGWVAPGKFKKRIIRTKLCHTITSPAITHEAIGIFLATGRYEYHLRMLRQTLYANSLQYLRAISEYFPDGTKVSRPEGGFLFWIDLPGSVDTAELYQHAIRHQISIAPGRMFTLRNQYDHCLRLSFGIPWDDRVDSALRTLGSFAKRLQRS